MHPVIVYCTAALGCLVFLLGLAVSILRFRSKIGSGQSPEKNSPLNKAIRAHANTAEFAPSLPVLFLYFGWRGPSDLALWADRGGHRLPFSDRHWPHRLAEHLAAESGAFRRGAGHYVCGAALSLLMLAGG